MVVDEISSVLLIAAGVVLGLLFIVISMKNRTEKSKDPDDTNDSDSLKLPIDKQTEPETGRIKDSINIIGNDIDRIFVYKDRSDRAERRVWVCRCCETENSIESNICILCGSDRE